MIDKIQVVYKKVKDLVPYAKNARLHSDEQVTQLVNAIKRFGWTTPILLDEQNEIIAGHGRIMAAKSLKMTEVPTIVLRGLSDDEKAALRIADNKIAMNSEWDMDFLKDELKSLDLLGFDLDLTGFGKDELKTILADPIPEGKTDPDAIPENVETRCKPGDLWILGDHRLLCGDSTNIQHVEKLMNGEKADMVFTDPPYGIDLDTDYSKMHGPVFSKRDGVYRETKKRSYRKIENDSEKIALNPILVLFENIREIFIFGGDYLDLPPAGSWVVWDKSVEEKYDNMFGSSFELCWSLKKHKRLIARIQWRGFYGVADDTNPNGKSAKVHPTQKPAKLAEWFFERWGKPDDLVVDLFRGSGSTLIAGEKTGRKCYGMEIDPHYCDIIIERWEKFTGKQAQLSNG